MRDIQNELNRLKIGIEEAKTEIARLEGRRQELLRQLKSEYGIESMEEAEERLKELQKEKVAKEEEIRAAFLALKSEYDW